MFIPGSWVLAAQPPELQPVRIISKRPAYLPETQVVRFVGKQSQSRLPDVLKNIPGFFGRDYGTSGSLSSASVRGSSPEGVLVELDGIRLNSPLTGMADLGRIPLLGIGRVEIVNGAGVGGANGGTIRILTNDEASSSLTLGLGSWGKKILGAQVGAENFFLAIGRESAANDYGFSDRGAPARRSNAQMDATSLFFKGKKDLGEAQNPLIARFMSSVDLRDLGIPGAINFPTPNAKQEDVGLLAAFSLEGNPQPDSEAKITLSQRSDRSHFQDPDAVLTPKNTDLGIDSFELKADWKSLDPVNGHFPALSLSDRRDSTNGTIRKQEDVLALRFKDEFLGGSGAWVGELGIDRFSGAGTALSPRLGYSRVAGDYRVHSSLGSAFRAPTFNERYWPEDNFAKGNPSVRPERISSLDLGLDGKFGCLKTGFTAFASLGKDQIVWQPSSGKWVPLNVSQTLGQGTEFELQYEPSSDLGFSGTYTFCRTTSDGKQLVARPMDQVNLSGRWGGEGKKLLCDLAYVGERFTTADNTDKLPSYWLLGLSGEWRIGKETLNARLDNLLDTTYQTVPYYPMPGKSFFLGLTHPF